MRWSDEDTAAMLAELGEAATLDGQPILALLESREVIAEDLGGMIVRETTALVGSTALAALDPTPGGELVVAGVAYTVVALVDDRAGFTSLRLEAAA